MFLPRWAEKLRLAGDREPCSGHGPRTCTPRRARAAKPSPATPAHRPGVSQPVLVANPATACCPPRSGTEKRNP
jgi:hypothetical protein